MFDAFRPSTPVTLDQITLDEDETDHHLVEAIIRQRASGATAEQIRTTASADGFLDRVMERLPGTVVTFRISPDVTTVAIVTPEPDDDERCTEFPYVADPLNCNYDDCEEYKDEICDGGPCQRLAQSFNSEVDEWCGQQIDVVLIVAIAGGAAAAVAIIIAIAACLAHRRKQTAARQSNGSAFRPRPHVAQGVAFNPQQYSDGFHGDHGLQV